MSKEVVMRIRVLILILCCICSLIITACGSLGESRDVPTQGVVERYGITKPCPTAEPYAFDVYEGDILGDLERFVFIHEDNISNRDWMVSPGIRVELPEGFCGFAQYMTEEEKGLYDRITADVVSPQECPEDWSCSWLDLESSEEEDSSKDGVDMKLEPSPLCQELFDKEEHVIATSAVIRQETQITEGEVFLAEGEAWVLYMPYPPGSLDIDSQTPVTDQYRAKTNQYVFAPWIQVCAPIEGHIWGGWDAEFGDMRDFAFVNSYVGGRVEIHTPAECKQYGLVCRWAPGKEPE